MTQKAERLVKLYQLASGPNGQMQKLPLSVPAREVYYHVKELKGYELHEDEMDFFEQNPEFAKPMEKNQKADGGKGKGKGKSQKGGTKPSEGQNPSDQEGESDSEESDESDGSEESPEETSQG